MWYYIVWLCAIFCWCILFCGRCYLVFVVLFGVNGGVRCYLLRRSLRVMIDYMYAYVQH